MAYELLPPVSDEEAGFEILPPVKEKKALSAGERFVLGLRAPIDAGTQLAGKANEFLADKGLVPRLKDNDAAGIADRMRRRREGAPEGVDWAGMAGEILSPASLALMALPGGTFLRAGALGAAGGVLNPAEDDESFWETKAKQATRGAVTGGAFNVGARALGRVVSPNAAQNAQLRMLRREGVDPTIGQALGGRIAKTEEKLTSVPFVGDMIANRRNAARTQFNQAALNRVTDALPPGTPRTTAIGTEGVAQAGDAVGRVYDEAARLVNGVRPDQRGLHEILATIRRAQRGGLTPQHQQTLRQVLNEAGTDITPRGSVVDFKRLDSFLGERARHFANSTSPYDRDLGTAIEQIQRSLRESVMRRRPQGSVLDTMADDAYGNLVRIENAAGKAAQTGGNFTPGQLLSAVKQGDPRIRHRGFSRGEARLQDLAQAGREVLGDTVPDSGTAGRMLLAGASGSGLGAGVFLDPTGASQAVASALAAGTLMYTPRIQRLLVAAASSRPAEAATARRALQEIAARLPAQAGLLEE